AEVRERFAVEELTTDDGRVTGIRGRSKGGPEVTERAGLVVGGDAKHPRGARAAGAPPHHELPARSMGCYTYWEGLPLEGGEMYAREGRAIGAWPTNGGAGVAD